MHIRVATPDDLPAILAVLARSLPLLHAQGNRQWDETYPTADILARDIARNDLYIAEHDARVAGFAYISSHPEQGYAAANLDPSVPAITTHRLAVDPDLRGLGIGIALLQHAERLARQRGITHLRLDTAAENNVSQALFAKLGYIFAGEISFSHRPGLRVLVYEKTLVSPALPNPIYTALSTTHQRFAETHGLAARYRADYIPFAGLATLSTAAFAHLRELFEPGESLFVTTENDERLPENLGGLELLRTIPGIQMQYLGPRPDMTEDTGVVTLTSENAEEMHALKAIAFPGFVGPRFMALGTFFGIRDEHGALVAMSGERFTAGALNEVSAVCTHPEHRGKGYAARLIAAVQREHTRRGQTTILHTTAENNETAIGLYHRLGFEITGRMGFHQLRRPA